MPGIAAKQCLKRRPLLRYIWNSHYTRQRINNKALERYPGALGSFLKLAVQQVRELDVDLAHA